MAHRVAECFSRRGEQSFSRPCGEFLAVERLGQCRPEQHGRTDLQCTGLGELHQTAQRDRSIRVGLGTKLLQLDQRRRRQRFRRLHGRSILSMSRRRQRGQHVVMDQSVELVALGRQRPVHRRGCFTDIGRLS